MPSADSTPGERMTEDVLDAERVRHLAGVLAACSTEALQGVARHVVAAGHGDALDGVRHAADRDPQRTRRGLLAADDEARSRAHALRKRGETQLHLGPIERLPAVGPEHLGEVFRVNAPEQHVRVGDGERAAAAIARGPRIGAGGFGTDAQARRRRNG